MRAATTSADRVCRLRLPITFEMTMPLADGAPVTGRGLALARRPIICERSVANCNQSPLRRLGRWVFPLRVTAFPLRTKAG
jgi:hypothetical protein